MQCVRRINRYLNIILGFVDLFPESSFACRGMDSTDYKADHVTKYAPVQLNCTYLAKRAVTTTGKRIQSDRTAVTTK